MNRKSTPDMLGSLMGAAIKPAIQLPVKQESLKEIKEDSLLATKQESNKTIKQEVVTVQTPSAEKEKATFNLSKSILEDLEDAWISIRKIRGDKRISKTDIVEQAVELAICEFKLKKQESQFYRKLAHSKARKQ